VKKNSRGLGFKGSSEIIKKKTGTLDPRIPACRQAGLNPIERKE
jgi:hypothetical protein